MKARGRLTISSKSDAAVQNFYPVTTYDQGYAALNDKDTEVGALLHSVLSADC